MIIESFDSKVKIEADEKIIEQIANSKFLYEYIPLVEIKDGLLSKPSHSATIRVRKGDFNLGWEFPKITYTNNKIDHKDIIALAEYCLERLRQEKGLYTIHANTTAVNKKGITIFGPPHSGKTTLSFLVAKELNGKVIANERSVFNPKERKICGRVTNISLNKYVKEILKQNFNQIQNLLGEDDVQIAFFMHPYISNKEDIIKYNHNAALWDVIEQTDCFIRGINRKVRMGKNSFFMLPSLDNTKLANRRLKDISEMLKDVPCYTIRGSYMSIVKSIKEKLYK